MVLTGKTKLSKISDNVISSKMGSELVTMYLDSGDYVHLNEIGTKIWELLDLNHDIDMIVTELTLEYKISKEDCFQEVKSFIEHIASLNLISLDV